jgi:capsular polysaccharide biosynthesis protein
MRSGRYRSIGSVAADDPKPRANRLAERRDQRQAPVDPPRQATLTEYLVLLRRNWPLIGAITLVCAVAGFGLSEARRARYEAQAYLALPNEANALDGLVTPAVVVTTPQQLAVIAQQAATSDPVLSQAKGALRLTDSLTHLRSEVSATVEPDSDVVVVAVEDHNPGRAAAIANADAVATINGESGAVDARIRVAVDQLENEASALGTARRHGPERTAIYSEIFRLQYLEKIATPDFTSAAVPTSASSPRTARDTAILAVIGLLLGFVVVLVRDAAQRGPAQAPSPAPMSGPTDR